MKTLFVFLIVLINKYANAQTDLLIKRYAEQTIFDSRDTIFHSPIIGIQNWPESIRYNNWDSILSLETSSLSANLDGNLLFKRASLSDEYFSSRDGEFFLALLRDSLQTPDSIFYQDIFSSKQIESNLFDSTNGWGIDQIAF